jgi:hypothetical protein
MILVNHASFFETLRNFIGKPGYTLRYIVGKHDFGTSLDMRLTEMIKEEFDLIFSTENYYLDEQ